MDCSIDMTKVVRRTHSKPVSSRACSNECSVIISGSSHLSSTLSGRKRYKPNCLANCSNKVTKFVISVQYIVVRSPNLNFEIKKSPHELF